MKKDYVAPRWSGEILDCSMPLTFDTYSGCSYNCLYCFAYFQKIHRKSAEIHSVDPLRVANLFVSVSKGKFGAIKADNRQFIPFIAERKMMQWGSLADQFDENEKKMGQTLLLMRLFDAIDYPLSFSTKSAWWALDDRYTGMFARHRHNWHLKVSIITLDKIKARKMEIGCPTPEQRLTVIRALSNLGINVTLRLRPFILGVSDDWKDLITAAKEAGANSVSTEFFCLEARADDRVKEKYRMMSEITGYDVWEFYMKNSKAHGYKRLSREMKLPIATEMKTFTNSLGLRIHFSDYHLRDLNTDGINCCGVPPAWNYFPDHFGKAALLSNSQGSVRFSDISKQINRFFNFSWTKAVGFNEGSNRHHAIFYDTTMAQWIRHMWNTPGSSSHFSRPLGLLPCGKDENGDIIYSRETPPKTEE